MELFGIGAGELVLILVIALIVFGPGKTAEIGATLGRAVREFRRASSELTQELTQSIAEVKEPVDEIRHLRVQDHPPAAPEYRAALDGKVCPQCSSPNAQDSRFCGHCGAELSTMGRQEA